MDDVRERLASYEPKLLSARDKRHAAVAMVLRELGDGLDILFIERAEREGDPWSGHMAFPGGRLEDIDHGPRAAAERETHEEVGVSLRDASYLGRLDDLEGRHAGRPSGLVISAHVYQLDEVAPVQPNYEVREAFWFPLAGLRDPVRRVDYRHPVLPDQRFPGILVGEPERHVVWGLTYRFLEVFFEVVGKPLPERWELPSGG